VLKQKNTVQVADFAANVHVSICFERQSWKERNKVVIADRFL